MRYSEMSSKIAGNNGSRVVLYPQGALGVQEMFLSFACGWVYSMRHFISVG